MGGAVNRGTALKEWESEWDNRQEMTVSCRMCPEFRVTAPAVTAREAARKHRDDMHPELRDRKPVARKKRVFSQAMTKEREEQINEERRQRMRSLGIA